MSLEEMRLDAIRKLTTVDDETILKEVLALLKDADEAGIGTVRLSNAYDKIKDQYGDVLQKLAQ